ncbi:MAG: TolC family protein [Akkermansia sp.]
MNYFYSIPLSAVLILSSCSSYDKQAINLDTNTTEWAQLTQKLCPAHQKRSKADLQGIALVLNPELRQARLLHQKSKDVALQTGYWDDPNLSLDLVRLLKENITNGGVGMGFTLPVTGLPQLAAQVAEQYEEADYWKLAAQERDLLTQLEVQRTLILINHAKLDLQRQHIRTLEQEDARLEGLYRLGEIDFAELQISKQRIFDTSEEGRLLDNEHLNLHLELTELLGIHPAAREMELREKLSASIPAAVAGVSGASLLDSPSLLATRANYDASELELKTQIRKQYPELGLSPGVEREDGNYKVGIGFSFSVPAWNRNRAGVAEAKAQRAIIGDQFVNEYRRLITQAASLSDQQQLHLRHCRSELQRAQELRHNLEMKQKLYDLGEIKWSELTEAKHELYQREMAYLDCLKELYRTQIQLHALNPHNKI